WPKATARWRQATAKIAPKATARWHQSYGKIAPKLLQDSAKATTRLRQSYCKAAPKLLQVAPSYCKVAAKATQNTPKLLQAKKRQQKRKNKKQPQAAEAPQTAVDFPKEDQQQQQQEQQERQNSQIRTVRARNGETALTAALRQGNVAAVRLLLQHGCAVKRLVSAACRIGFKLPTGRRAALLAAASLADAVSQALATADPISSRSSARLLAPVGRLHILPRPGLSVQFGHCDRLPSLPCVLLLGNAVFNTGAEATAARVGFDSGAGAQCERLAEQRAPDAAESGRLFHFAPAAPLRVALQHCRLGASGSFRLPADGRFRYWLERTK
uniref:ANK_REP_REGION domain-containing protein n=1 Tax=Macrostomum lignano TaxID=282301 RepID=A0A1I8FI44_9PLAT